MSNAARRDAPPGSYVTHHVSRGLVYTRQNASSAGLDTGIRGIAGRAGPLHHRLPRFLVSLVPGSLRRPDRAAHGPASRADDLLRAGHHGRVGGRVLLALPRRPEGRGGVPPQALPRAPRRPRDGGVPAP